MKILADVCSIDKDEFKSKYLQKIKTTISSSWFLRQRFKGCHTVRLWTLQLKGHHSPFSNLIDWTLQSFGINFLLFKVCLTCIFQVLVLPPPLPYPIHLKEPQKPFSFILIKNFLQKCYFFLCYFLKGTGIPPTADTVKTT